MECDIKYWIVKRKYKNKHVAKQMGISQNTLSRWINNHSRPSLINAFKLADILDCKVDDLYKQKRRPLN